MPVSLHSHSGQYCQHAYGELEQVIQKAIDMGFVCFGMSEHMPRSQEKDLYPEEVELKYTPSCLATTYDNFVSNAQRLIAQYETPNTSLLLGMETEYIRLSDLDLVTQLRTQHQIDYIVGSVHHVAEVPVDYSDAMYTSIEHMLGSTETVFRVYFNAQYEMLKILKPEVVGHFDLVRLFRPYHPLSKDVWGLIDRNIQCIVSYGGLVEINSRALKKNLPWPYPFKDIVQRMMACNVKFTISDDSHGPNDVAIHYDKLRDYLLEMGIGSIYYLTKIDGHVITLEIPNVAYHSFWSKNNLVSSSSSSSNQSSKQSLTIMPISPLIAAPSPVLTSRSPTSPVSIQPAPSRLVNIDGQPKLPGAFPSAFPTNNQSNEMDSLPVSESELVISDGGTERDNISNDAEIRDHTSTQTRGANHESPEGCYILDESASNSDIDDEEFVMVEANDVLGGY
ncbi:histidinol-phosphatase [Synchytrium endobioticum]|uniref:histidinol-phosphatase n=1 Tax=Synchytrium endobioticum TaxID=286115 RepID=A0A507D0E8_9FUNG|nr:histidinol-phosphatase [Synchytrium endobioticum]TPX50409.1 histidinol-phosphatase [Synchytrium endobioticum]